jgi:hypothetical protein
MDAGRDAAHDGGTDADGPLSCGTDLSHTPLCVPLGASPADAGVGCPGCQVLYAWLAPTGMFNFVQDGTALYWNDGTNIYGISKDGGTPWIVSTFAPLIGCTNGALDGRGLTSLCGAVIYGCSTHTSPHYVSIAETPTPCGTPVELTPITVESSGGNFPYFGFQWDDAGIYMPGYLGSGPGPLTVALDRQGNRKTAWDAGGLGVAQDPDHLYFVDDYGSGSLFFQVAPKSGGALSLLYRLDGGSYSYVGGLPDYGLSKSGERLYWSGLWEGDAGIWSLSIDGGAPTLEALGCFGPPVADITGIYARLGCNQFGCSATYCASHLVRVRDGGIVSMTPIAVDSFLLDAENLYWEVFDQTTGVQLVVRSPK